ncbi:MAG: hypothetical protein IJU16_08410, partial [Clostridia bacterium]|nr:hypothetical protein [Clostridia bacterium]
GFAAEPQSIYFDLALLRCKTGLVFDGEGEGGGTDFIPHIAPGYTKEDPLPLIDEALAYCEGIEDRYPEIADDLYCAIVETEAVVSEDGATLKDLDAAIRQLKQSLKAAKAAVEAADFEAIENVIAQIDTLPSTENINIADQAAVEATRDAYDSLTDEQKAMIDDETLEKLAAAEDALEIAIADKHAGYNMADAFALYRAASGQIELDAEEYGTGDFDRDGVFNIGDAFMLYRKVSGN